MVSDGQQVAAMTRMANECYMPADQLMAMMQKLAPDRLTFGRMLRAIPDAQGGRSAARRVSDDFRYRARLPDARRAPPYIATYVREPSRI